jgi:hypothetical protein
MADFAKNAIRRLRQALRALPRDSLAIDSYETLLDESCFNKSFYVDEGICIPQWKLVKNL